MKIYHACSLSQLLQAARSVAEYERLAGVCDGAVLRTCAARAFKRPASQWQKLMACLRGRIAQRYARGELIDVERRALAVWCGEKVGELT